VFFRANLARMARSGSVVGGNHGGDDRRPYCLHFLQTRSRTGPAAIRAAIGHVALLWGIILLMLNLRLNQWMATFRGTNLADFHRILPEWAIPLATLTLLIWVGILVALTKPRRPASLDETGRSGR